MLGGTTDEGLTGKHFVDIHGDLASKLLEALAHAEISNALHMAAEALSESYLPSWGHCPFEGSTRYPHITVVTV